jgi:hypothetical protein
MKVTNDEPWMILAMGLRTMSLALCANSTGELSLLTWTVEGGVTCSRVVPRPSCRVGSHRRERQDDFARMFRVFSNNCQE